jgi:hypothetical protein
MGSPVSQVAQPISQQPPQQGGKTGGIGNFAVDAHKRLQQAQENPANMPEPMVTAQVQPTGKSGPPPAQSSQTPQGLGKGGQNQDMTFAQGGRVTFPGQGGQPKMGVPNTYSNTVGQWDNASIQPQQSRMGGGKGKG